MLIFATIISIRLKKSVLLLANQFNIITLKEAGIDIDIPEPHDTIEANASEKSRTIYQLTKQNCFGDDTGLEVEALNGEPGVKSARYAGEEKNFEANIDKLLHKLKTIENRNAQFKTIISLMWNGEEFLFEGIIKEKSFIKEKVKMVLDTIRFLFLKEVIKPLQKWNYQRKINSVTAEKQPIN